MQASSPVDGGESGEGNLRLCRAINGNPCSRTRQGNTDSWSIHTVPWRAAEPRCNAMLQKAQCCGCVRALQTQKCWMCRKVWAHVSRCPSCAPSLRSTYASLSWLVEDTRATGTQLPAQPLHFQDLTFCAFASVILAQRPQYQVSQKSQAIQNSFWLYRRPHCGQGSPSPSSQSSPSSSSSSS